MTTVAQINRLDGPDLHEEEDVEDIVPHLPEEVTLVAWPRHDTELDPPPKRLSIPRRTMLSSLMTQPDQEDHLAKINNSPKMWRNPQKGTKRILPASE